MIFVTGILYSRLWSQHCVIFFKCRDAWSLRLLISWNVFQLYRNLKWNSGSDGSFYMQKINALQYWWTTWQWYWHSPVYDLLFPALWILTWNWIEGLARHPDTMAKLDIRVWNDCKLTVNTKLQVFQACMCNSLIYGREIQYGSPTEGRKSGWTVFTYNVWDVCCIWADRTG